MAKRRQKRSGFNWKTNIGGMPVWGIATSVAVILALVGVAAVGPALRGDANATPHTRPSDAFEYDGDTVIEAVEPLTVPRTPDGAVRLLVTGDSLSGGYFASTEAQGFSALVAGALGTVEKTSAVRADQTLTTVAAITEVPADLGLAIVELGTNDVGVPTPLDEFEATYVALLDRIRTASPDAAIVCAGTWTAGGQAYDQIIAESCAAVTGRYVELRGLFNDSGNRGPVGVETFAGISDDFHPNDTGHQAIADAILAQLSF